MMDRAYVHLIEDIFVQDMNRPINQFLKCKGCDLIPSLAILNKENINELQFEHTGKDNIPMLENLCWSDQESIKTVLSYAHFKRFNGIED